MLTLALHCVLLAAPVWSAERAAPSWRTGDERSFASVAVLGVALDGRVALALERGWADEGVDYSYVVQLVDPRAQLPTEQLSYGTDDGEHASLEAAWQAKGDAFRALLDGAHVTARHVGWSSSADHRPPLLELKPDPVDDAYFNQIAIEVRLGGQLWFRTERSLIRSLAWSGVVLSRRGELHVFLAQDRGWEGVPGRALIIEALPPAPS